MIKEMNLRLYLIFLLLAAPPGFSFAEDLVKSVAPGVQQIEKTLPGPVAVHLVRIDRSAFQYDMKMGFAPVRKSGSDVSVATPAYKLRKATVREITSHYHQPELPVIAAINAGFFSETNIVGVLGDGDNLVQITRPGESYARWPVFGWTSGNVPLTAMGLSFSKGQIRFESGTRLSIDGLNRVRGEDALVCYTPGWGSLRSMSTGTTAAGVEIIVTGVSYPLRPAKWIAGQIAAIRSGSESLNNPIPLDGLVLSARGKRASEVLAHARTGERVTLRFPVDDPVWNNAELLATGAGWLVRNGKVSSDDRGLYSKTLPNRHPRTAIAWNEKFLYLIVVDGRQSEHSVGMSLDELAEFCLTLDAMEAINMDGGGSSTLVIGDQVVNRPSDGSRPDGSGGVERPVGNAILLVDTSHTPAGDFRDDFDSGGRCPGWDDKFAPCLIQPFNRKAPDGDGSVLVVTDPAGGYNTCRIGRVQDADVDVSAWLYCEYRPNLGSTEYERIGLFVRDDGHGAFDMSAERSQDAGNNYLLTWDSNNGRIRAGKTVQGELTDFIGSRVLKTRSAWHRFRIRADGPRIRYWLNDALLADVEDTSHTHGFSGIGYHEYFKNDRNIRGTRAEGFVYDVTPFVE